MVMRVLHICALSILVSLPLAGQQSPAPPAQQSSASASSRDRKKDHGQDQQKDQQKDRKKKSAAKANPFPAAQSEKAQQEAGGKGGSLPSAPAAQPPKKSAAQANPFPEAQSRAAARKVQQQAPPTEPPPSANSSSSYIPGLMPPEQGQSPSSGAQQPLQLNPKLGKKDTSVGMFYLESGDYQGAYDRFKQAVQVDPGDGDAIYGLGVSAMQLGKRDVALHYLKIYIEAIPYGHHAKQVRKALKKLNAGPGR
jgi:tetratricopeptide (TPR) repeat protein